MRDSDLPLRNPRARRLGQGYDKPDNISDERTGRHSRPSSTHTPETLRILANKSGTDRAPARADTKSLYNEDISRATSDADVQPTPRKCPTCVRISKETLRFGPYSHGRFVAGNDQCIICNLRKSKKDMEAKAETPTIPASGSSNYRQPSARTVSPSPSEGERVIYRY